MKQLAIIFFILFPTTNLIGQYRLDVGVGYDLPKFRNFEAIGYYTFSNLKANGIQLNLGLERNFNQYYSHTFGIGFVGRVFQNTSIDADPSYSIPITYETKNNISSFRLYYLSKFYIDKKIGLSINIGAAYERQQFRKSENGSSKTFESNTTVFSGNDFIGTLGLTYEYPISKNINLYTQATASRSLVMWGYSQFNPISGNFRGLLDYRINIGMTYNLQDKMLTPNARMNRDKSDLYKTIYLRNIELRTFAILESRNIKHLDDDYSNYVYNEYSTFNSKLNKNKFYGFGVGASFSKNRFYAVLDVKWQHYNYDVESFKYTTYSYGHGPSQGYIENYKNEKDVLKFKTDRIGFIGGIGVKIFRPTSKINVIPLVKIAYGHSIHQSIESNYYFIHSKYEWHDSPIPTSKSEWDSTYYPSRFSINSKNFDFLIGSMFTVSITQRIRLNLEVLCSLSKSPIIQINNPNYIEKLSIYSTIGLSYNFSLKDKPKPMSTLKFQAEKELNKANRKQSRQQKHESKKT